VSTKRGGRREYFAALATHSCGTRLAEGMGAQHGQRHGQHLPAQLAAELLEQALLQGDDALLALLLGLRTSERQVDQRRHCWREWCTCTHLPRVARLLAHRWRLRPAPLLGGWVVVPPLLSLAMEDFHACSDLLNLRHGPRLVSVICAERRMRWSALTHNCRGEEEATHTCGCPRSRLVVATHKQVATHEVLLLALSTPALLNAINAVVAHRRLRGRESRAFFL